jgi:hypothetical protein
MKVTRGMATPNDDRLHSTPRAANVLARVFTCLFGLAAIVWGGSMLPLFWSEASANSTAVNILQGDTFKPQWILDKLKQADSASDRSYCNSAALRSAVIFRLFILDETVKAGNKVLSVSIRPSVSDATRAALSCEPTDSFLWLTLFWLDASTRGVEPNNLNYLRLSYLLGPNESWIAQWRNQLTLRVFDQLPPDLGDDAVNEFVKLVNSGQFRSETATIFQGVSAAGRMRIVERLKTASDDVSRQIFARTLYDRGVDIAIPGVEVMHDRGLDIAIPGVVIPPDHPSK